MAETHRYVVVEGVIGVGKTTLVEHLSRALSARMVFEEFEQNPFLASFYQDKEAFAFSTQVFFLMSRFRQQETLAQGELFAKTTLSDYLFDKDRLFALLLILQYTGDIVRRVGKIISFERTLMRLKCVGQSQFLLDPSGINGAINQARRLEVFTELAENRG